MRPLLTLLVCVMAVSHAQGQELKAIPPLSAGEFAEALKKAAEGSSLFEILSLDWKDWSDDGKAERLQRWRVLAKAQVAADEENLLVDTLIRAVALAPEESADCFVPRHAIRITGPHGTFAFLICFTCSQGEVYSAGGAMRPVLLSPEFESIVDGVFRAHALPKAE